MTGNGEGETPGNGAPPPSLDSLSASAPSPESPPTDAEKAIALWRSVDETSSATALARTVKGQFVKGKSGNPHGRTPGVPNLNTELLKAVRRFRVKGKDGTKLTFIDALLARALQDLRFGEKIIDKIFAAATPQAPATVIGVTQHSSEQNVAVDIVSDPVARELAARLEERVAAGRLDPGGNGSSRQ